MDHLRVLREKVGSLRAEIAQIHELNQQYRRLRPVGDTEQIAHAQRHERLQEIQKELARLLALGRSVVSAEQAEEESRERVELIKKRAS